MVAVHGPGPVESQLFVWHRRCSIRHNLKVKYREGFRPFAPSVLREVVSEWFELEGDSSYMLIVADVRKDRRRAITIEEQALFGIEKLNVARLEIPAVTHVGYSAHIQTVHANTNPLFHRLLKCFKELTGCPVLGQHQLQCAR
jgi:carbamoyltransferase